MRGDGVCALWWWRWQMVPPRLFGPPLPRAQQQTQQQRRRRADALLEMKFGGVIVLRPPERLSYDPATTPLDRLTREQQLELTREQTDRILQKLVGKPILTEHGRVAVGKVTEAFFDAQGNACVRFALDDTPWAQSTKRLIEAGYLRGLSLSHYLGTDEPTEVSVCYKGAREGTFITEVNTAAGATAAAPREEPQRLASDYLPPAVSASHRFVRASALLTMENATLLAPGQVGLPLPGTQSANPHMTTFNAAAGAPSAPRTLSSLMPGAVEQQQPQATPTASGAPKKRRRVILDGKEVEVEEVETASAVAQQQPQLVPASSVVPPPAASTAAAGPTAPPAMQQQQPPQANTAAPLNTEGKSHEETRIEILRRMAQSGGKLSNEEQVALIESFVRHKRDREALVKQVEELKSKVEEGSQTAKRSVDNFFDAFWPFLRTYLGSELTPEREQQMRSKLEQTGEKGFMDVVGPQLIRASAIATSFKQQYDEQRQLSLDPRVARALSALQHGEANYASQGLPVYQTTSAAAAPAPAAAAPAPPQMVFASSQYGWQPTPQLLVQASGGGGGGSAAAADPFAALDALEKIAPPVTSFVYDRKDLYERARKDEGPPDPNAHQRFELPPHVLRR